MSAKNHTENRSTRTEKNGTIINRTAGPTTRSRLTGAKLYPIFDNNNKVVLVTIPDDE